MWLLVYDRQTQQKEATNSITAGWGGPQAMSGPVLVIPYRANATETVVQNGQSVTRTSQVMKELTLAPEAVEVSTQLRPDVRKRSIYEAVVYEAAVSGKAHFVLPPDLPRTGVDPTQMDMSRAELRFGLSDPRGLGANPRVTVAGRPLRLLPGGGSGGGRGFFAWVDASGLASQPLAVDFAYEFRGNASLSMVPQAGDTRWTVKSSWPSPSFGGDFLPGARSVRDEAFEATYRVGNLALGRSWSHRRPRASTRSSDSGPTQPLQAGARVRAGGTRAGGSIADQRVTLIEVTARRRVRYRVTSGR